MDRLSPQLLIETSRTVARLGVTAQDFDDTAPADSSAGRAHVARTSSWDTKFVQSCGYWAHYDHDTQSSAWPIPVDLTTEELYHFGEAHDALHAIPESGDIFLQYVEPLGAFTHSGVVVDVLDAVRMDGGRVYDVRTIEGDIDDYGRLGGGQARRARRRLYPNRGDCFLRWSRLTCESVRRARLGPTVS